MSVRASLEVDARPQARFNTDRAVSGAYQGQSQIPSDESEGTEGSGFFDSLKAYLSSQNPGDGRPELDRNVSRMASAPSMPSAKTNASDDTGANPDFVSTAGDPAASLATVLKHLAKGRHGNIVPSSATQIQPLSTNETKAAVTTSFRKSVPIETAKDNEADIRAVQVATAMVPPQVPAVPAPIPDKHTGRLDNAISDSVQNKTAAVEMPVSVSSSSGASVPWRNLENGFERGEPSNAWSTASAGGRREVSQLDDGHALAVANGHHTEHTDDHAAPVPTRVPASSGLDANKGPLMNEDGGQSSSSNEIIPAAGTEGQSRADRGYSNSARQEFAVTSQHGPNASQDRQPNLERPVDANGGSEQTVPGSTLVEAGGKHSADSTPSSLSSGTDRLARTAGKAKPSSSRSDQSSRHSQDLKQGLVDSATASAFRSPEISRIADVTSGGSTNLKSSEATASDGRLQNTFSALEPGTRREMGAFNWTRTGHMQAEAGYQDPALGWIGIRAETSGGAIHATLIPQSSDAAQVLGGHVAGLHTYLAENHTPIETLSLASSGGNPQQFTGHHPGQEAQQDSGQNASPRHASQAVTEPQRVSASGIGGAVRTASASDGLFASSPGNNGSRGVRISVLA